jgi:hypothetical protein
LGKEGRKGNVVVLMKKEVRFGGKKEGLYSAHLGPRTQAAYGLKSVVYVSRQRGVGEL